jgi:hypothetical protein
MSLENVPLVTIAPSNQKPGEGEKITPGKFGNAFIRGINLDIGLSDNPTTIQVALVNNNGKYKNYGSSLSFLSPFNITIGQDLKIVSYLVGQKTKSSSNDKTLELEFIDGSHILDRVYVGGIGVHTLDRRAYNYQGQVATIPVVCESCYADSIISVNSYKDLAELKTVIPITFPPLTGRVLRVANGNFVGNNQYGGAVFVGNEKFTNTSCDLPEVDYSFTELKQACKNMKIDIDIPDLSLNGAGAPLLRRTYWGTLREVLQKWCADFGIAFTYDFSDIKPKVLGINTRIDVLTNRLNTLASLASTGDPKNVGKAIIESVDLQTDIKSTYCNSTITTFKKKRKKKDFSSSTFYGTAYKAFQIPDILGADSMDQRSVAAFQQCTALAKFSPSIRSLFLAWMAQANQDFRYFRPLGFFGEVSVGDVLGSDGIQEIIDECLDTETYRDLCDYFDPAGNFDVDLYIGAFSSEIGDKYLDWEKKIADNFLGQYFYTNLWSQADEEYGGVKLCFTGTDYRHEIKSTLTPKPQNLAKGTASVFNATSMQVRLANQGKLPFSDVLWGPIPYNPWTGASWFSDPRLKIYKRSSANWQTKQEDFDAITQQKTNNGTKDLVKPYLPRFQEIRGLVETRLRARFRGTNFDFTKFLDNIKKDQTPCLLIVPSATRIAQLMNISSVVPTFNASEETYLDGIPPINLDCEGSTLCELQENLEKRVCDPETRCPYLGYGPGAVDGSSALGKFYAVRKNNPFPEGLQDNIAAGFVCSFGGKSVNVIFPASTYPLKNNFYLANYKEDIKATYYTQRIENVLGGINVPGNLAQTKVVLNNVSSDTPIFADPQNPAQTITKIYVHGYGFLTLTEYHNFLQNFSISVNSNPRTSLDIKFASLEFGHLKGYINPQNGLNKLTLEVGENGASASVSFQSRERKLPTQDMFTKEIEPQIIAKGFPF